MDDERLEKMRGLAAEAGLKEMAAAIVELRFLRALHSPETLAQGIEVALRAVIQDQGPITEDKVGSAAKRIIAVLRSRAAG